MYAIQPTVFRSAAVWCEQIQQRIQMLIGNGLQITYLTISLPRDVHYAIFQNVRLLVDDYPFLNHPHILFRKSTEKSTNAQIKFSFEFYAIEPGSEQYLNTLKSSPIPDAVPKLKLPPGWHIPEELNQARERGELDAYYKKTEEDYIQHCKKFNVTPEYF